VGSGQICRAVPFPVPLACGSLALERLRRQTWSVFVDFETDRIDVGEASVYVRHGGNGPPVLLVHGHPRTSATWHRVAPQLVERGFTVVCPDMRGYGRSRGPAPTSDHSAHSKRAVADDLASVMRSLGHDRFALVGHDRGSYVALRLALDHPDVATRLVLLDSIPISEHLSRANAEFATRWWHWFFFAQPKIPERVINADPDRWYHGDPETMGHENYEEWREAIRNPEVVTAMLEDYRAGLTIDRQHEEADRAAGIRLQCPLLLLWSLRDDLEDLYGDPLVIWRDWADDVRGHGIDSGHHMAEEVPDILASSLGEFLSPR
jgi:haloacetate dehalogenase